MLDNRLPSTRGRISLWVLGSSYRLFLGDVSPLCWSSPLAWRFLNEQEAILFLWVWRDDWVGQECLLPFQRTEDQFVAPSSNNFKSYGYTTCCLHAWVSTQYSRHSLSYTNDLFSFSGPDGLVNLTKYVPKSQLLLIIRGFQEIAYWRNTLWHTDLTFKL